MTSQMVRHSRGSDYGKMAHKLCRGVGVEIGALHKPFDLDACVIYVDRFRTNRLQELYHNDPRSGSIQQVDIVCENDNYDFFDNNAFDFVISSHVFELISNPGRVLKEWIRIIKPGGYVYFVIPDMRYTKDRNRKLTPAEELIEKYETGISSIDYGIYHEAMMNTDGGRKITEDAIRRAFEMQVSIPVHTFTPDSVKNFMEIMGSKLGFELVHLDEQGMHIHVALNKLDDASRSGIHQRMVHGKLFNKPVAVKEQATSNVLNQKEDKASDPLASDSLKQEGTPGRRNDLLGGLNLKNLRGIEIGPLDKPVISRDSSTVLYADHADAQELRKKYSKDTSVNINAIPEIDIVLSGNNLAEQAGWESMDYIVASHVIEHTPDFIGFLIDCHNALKVGGVLSVVVPDCRYTFDVFRRPTFFEDVEAAHESGAVRPSVDQIIDHAKHVVEIDRNLAWKDMPRALQSARLKHPRSNLPKLIERHRTGAYMDAHCWVFNPDSFLKLMKNVCSKYQLAFVISKFIKTRPMHAEFYVRLEKVRDYKGS